MGDHSAVHDPGNRRRNLRHYLAETTEAFFGGVPLSSLYDNTTIAVAKILGDGTRRRTRTFLEPGDGGFDAGVVGRGVPDEVAVELLLDDLTGCGDDLAVTLRSLLEPPQGPQDRGDLPLLQPHGWRDRTRSR